MFVTFLLFQSNLYVVLEIFSRKKTLNKKTPGTQLHFTRFTVRGQTLNLTNFLKCVKNVIFPKFLVNALA